MLTDITSFVALELLYLRIGVLRREAQFKQIEETGSIKSAMAKEYGGSTFVERELKSKISLGTHARRRRSKRYIVEIPDKESSQEEELSP